jgi:hypothetical protein
MARLPIEQINPHTKASLRIGSGTRVASGGSCFAQNIATALQRRGYNYFMTEPPPLFFSAEAASMFGYGVFSARYGNLYTSLQWLQLIKRAFGEFVPVDQIWKSDNGRYFDLLRPYIVPSGFSSLGEIEADIKQHLSAVRKLFSEVEVFVFTLGLTEGWLSTVDGTIYPTCPGCGSAGEFDPKKYGFHNFDVTETTDHLFQAIRRLKEINASVQVLLTVSPVPLIATMEPRHVLQSTTYSKSVLRVAAEESTKTFDNVHYFASYEIITGTGNTSAYFGEDRRTVTQAGIEHVMACFFYLYSDGSTLTPRERSNSRTAVSPRGDGVVAEIVCDEERFFRALAATNGLSRIGEK